MYYRRVRGKSIKRTSTNAVTSTDLCVLGPQHAIHFDVQGSASIGQETVDVSENLEGKLR